MTPKILSESHNPWWSIPVAAAIALLVGLRHLGSEYRNSSLYQQ